MPYLHLSELRKVVTQQLTIDTDWHAASAAYTAKLNVQKSSVEGEPSISDMFTTIEELELKEESSKHKGEEEAEDAKERGRKGKVSVAQSTSSDDWRRKCINDRNHSVTSGFLKVLHTLPGVDKQRQVFKLREILQHLSTYICDNRSRFFDSRNISIVLCHKDLLGEAFGVKAFHRTQVM